MENKSQNIIIVCIVTAAVTFICSFFYLKNYAYPFLSYHEGWCTFYYDSHYINDNLSSFDGVCVLIKGFILQFFAHPYHGAIVLGGLISFLSVFLTYLLLRYVIRFNNKTISFALSSLISFAVCVLICFQSVSSLCCVRVSTLLSDFSSQSNFTLQYMRASYHIRNGEWDSVIKVCMNGSSVNAVLLQNCLNMAKAEKCELGQTLLDEPCSDINSIFSSEIENQYVAALLSDIYYSMGHIAQAQRYAFEANEKMDNMSPRLLQRLIQTNILYGQYAIADKYLKILEKTRYYKDWCADVRCVLWNDEAVKQHWMFNTKYLCLFEDNRFSGIKGLDDDLLQVARATRGTLQCRVTLEYLGSLYILAGYRDKFTQMIDEFKGSNDLPIPLPKYFSGFYDYSKTETAHEQE